MVSLNKNKNSKYIVSIGWAMEVYADNKNEVNDIINKYGREKIQVEKIK